MLDETLSTQITSKSGVPNWLPGAALAYISHTTQGISIRAIARKLGCHPSTILRQIRKYESRRDDPLVNEALDTLAQNFSDCPLFTDPSKEQINMVKSSSSNVVTDAEISREARRILRRLCETGAYLLVSPKMERAAVFKEIVPGRPNRIAVVESDFINAFALKEWISGKQVGKIGRYMITPTGRKALKRLISEDMEVKSGVKSASSAFQDQHKELAERTFADTEGNGKKTMRYNLAESPLMLLGRKKDKSGMTYLSPELLAAGERLREDFEQAQLGPRVAQNWDRFLTSGSTSGWNMGGDAGGSSGARDRVGEAMKALGPGLADVALRVCCFLEGLEKAEKRLGWSARSGKVVLKISLQRLANHYGISVPEHRKVS